MSDFDVQRRTAPPPPPPPERTEGANTGGANTGSAAANLGTVDGASGARDVNARANTATVDPAAAGADNAARGEHAQAFLGSPVNNARPGDPALPVNATGNDVNAAYTDAGAEPPNRIEGASGALHETPAERDGDPATASDAIRDAQNQREAIAALGQRAGVDTSGGTGRMDPATIARRADHISWSLQNNQPVHGADGNPREIPMSADERAALNGSDPDARRRTADSIGQRVATQEAFERAVGGPENARRIEQSYQQSTSEQRRADAPQIDRQGNAERLARVAEVATLATGLGGLARGLLSGGLRGLARLGIGPLARQTLNFTERNLQKGFTKHGADFGLRGNWNPSRAGEFRDAVTRHINNPGTRRIEGTYRGQQVVHHVDPRTGLNVVADRAGNYVSGWRLHPDQLRSVMNGGRLF